MYVKLFASIYQGTLRGNSHGLLVFTNLLAHADKDGFVDIHPRAISEEVGLPVDHVRAALEVLESPDDESRSPEEQGRRIVRMDDHRAWGWRVVNYAKYRAIRNEEDRREQNRQAQERFRQKSKPRKPKKAHTEAEAYTEAKKEEDGPAVSSTPPSPSFLGDENETQIPARRLVTLSAEFSLPRQWGMDAEALGWPRERIIRLAEKFRQYYVAGKGLDTKLTVKGWRQKWSNWLTKEESYL